MKTIIYIRHGVASNANNLKVLEEALEEALKERFDNITINNEEYDWKAPIVESGLTLARDIRRESKGKQVILIGHSQGGLVCRIAAVALRGTRRHEDAKAEDLGSAVDLVKKIESSMRIRNPGNNSELIDILGVVLLATPNCGALTYGQLSVLGRIASRGIHAAAEFLFGVEDLADCTSDRLFRALQFFEVQEIPYLSISGSAINRYSRINHGDLSDLPLVGRLGVHLEKPNDLLVEDCSVDMEQSSFPIEVKGEYQHVRRYLNCTDVSHTSIHSNRQVHKLLKSQIEEWIKCGNKNPRGPE